MVDKTNEHIHYTPFSRVCKLLKFKKTHLTNKWASGLEVLVEIFTCKYYILSISKCTSLIKKKDSKESFFSQLMLLKYQVGNQRMVLYRRLQRLVMK